MTIGSISEPRDHKLYTPYPKHQTTRQHDASLHHISSYILFRYARLGWSPSCRGSSPEQIEQLLAPLFDAEEQVESWVQGLGSLFHNDPAHFGFWVQGLRSWFHNDPAHFG